MRELMGGALALAMALTGCKSDDPNAMFQLTMEYKGHKNVFLERLTPMACATQMVNYQDSLPQFKWDCRIDPAIVEKRHGV